MFCFKASGIKDQSERLLFEIFVEQWLVEPIRV